MQADLSRNGLLGIGQQTLHRWRETLERTLGDGAAACLQEMGAAMGEDLYAAFCRWLPERVGLTDPGELDAERLGDVLSAFFGGIGWGAISVERLGSRGLVLTSNDWAEAQPGSGSVFPTCFVSSGLFSDLLTRLAGAPLAIMEVECRSRNDRACRFFAGAPETLQAAYEAMSEGRDYRGVFGA
jgi:predicted hydrocarbon binding protein